MFTASIIPLVFGLWVSRNYYKMRDTCVVGTKEGQVRGSTMKSTRGDTIFSFRSVPYAKPPVEERRFKRSEPAESWEGEKDCCSESPKSLQPNVLFPDWLVLRRGSEDCLYLNVYTKNVQTDDNYPIAKVCTAIKLLITNIS